MALPVEIATLLRQAPEVLVTSHEDPDGDALGSLVALGLALKSLSKKVVLVLEEPVPAPYLFLAESKEVLEPTSLTSLALPATVVFCDCSTPERVGPSLVAKLREAEFWINIDHHVSNTYFGHLNYVEPSAAATAELIFQVIKALNVAITKEVATALYLGIVTDTGSFRFENTKPETLRQAAELLSEGADLAAIRENLWEEKSLLSLRLLAAVLPTLTFAAGGKIAWISLEKAALDCLGARNGDLEGLVDYPRSVAGVEVGMFFRETEPGLVKVGLRSKKYLDVNLLAQEFGGGGHPRAAGCTVKGFLSEVIPRVVNAASKRLDKGLI